MEHAQFAILDTRDGTEHKATLLNALTIEDAMIEAWLLLPDEVQDEYDSLEAYEENLATTEYYQVVATVWPAPKEPVQSWHDWEEAKDWDPNQRVGWCDGWGSDAGTESIRVITETWSEGAKGRRLYKKLNLPANQA